jgi:Domain of unknown function (DUF4157)
LTQPLQRQALAPRAPAGRATQGRFTIQRRCACGGHCPVCQERQPIQTKLEVGDPDDRFEQEADRVANEVMGTWPTQTAVPHVQRMSESGLELEEEEEAAIRTKPARDQPAHDSHLNAGHANSITSPQPGTPLPEHPRALMEQRLGADFSDVRTHTGAEATDLNRRLHSQAFTYGRDIWFGAGESPANLRLLAHELTHVVQQTGFVGSLIQRQTLTPAQLGSIGPLTTQSGVVLPEEFISLWLIPNQCDPYRPLTLGDFAEDTSLPAGRAGRTRAGIVSITVHGVPGFGAKLLNTSGLLPPHKHPTDRSKTPCGGLINNCTAAINAGSPAFSINNTSSCAAAPRPSGRATSVAECTSVVGTACDNAVKKDSDRVLAHEQLHFDIACVVVAKANLAFWRAGLPARINIQAIGKVRDTVNSQYDGDTGHGCITAQQQTWEDRVRKQFLPSVTF